MDTQSSISFGDRVRVVSTPETEASGLAGLVGQVYGETTPSQIEVEVVGELTEDYAINVNFEEREGSFWFASELLELVDHAAGTTFSIAGGSEYIRDEEGNWNELSDNEIRFTPSRVEGLPDVSEVALYPDRFKVKSSGKWIVFQFEDIARWPSPPWIWKLFGKTGWRPSWLPVADREGCLPKAERYFAFYTQPPIAIFMPTGIPEEHVRDCFHQIQDMLLAGGYHSWDLS